MMSRRWSTRCSTRRRRATIATDRRETPRTKAYRHPVAHVANAPAIRAEDLSVELEGHLALSDVSFSLESGVRLAIVGPNGAGKSTLLRTLAGLLSPSTGHVEIHGHPPLGHICIAYVPQQSAVDWRFPVTVLDVVSMGRVGRVGPLRRLRAADRRIVRDAIATVDLERLSGRTIDALSGGERQRMFLARALAQESEIILMDEPFAGLDLQSRDDLVDVLIGLRQQNVTLLVALHDLGLAASHFDRLLLLKTRSLGFGAPDEVLTESALQQAYGSCLRMVQTAEGALIVHDTSCAGETP